MKRIFVVGGVTWDTVLHLGALPEPRPQTVFARASHETVGSTGAGKAMNLARLGFGTSLHAMIGDDVWGQQIRSRMAREPLVFLPDTDPQGTERHVNLMADDGGRVSIYATYATFEPELELSRLEPLVADCDVVALNIINYCRRVIPLAQAHGKPIWCDIHDWDGENDYHREFVDAADVLFMSSDAMPEPRAFMEAQVAAGKQLVVCTRGRRGALALAADRSWVETPIVDAYEPVDTNGAGDAFFAGFLFGHARGYPLVRCMQLGAVVAGMCVTSTELAHPELSAARVEREWRAHFGER